MPTNKDSSSTSRSTSETNPYEAENQEILKAYGAEKVDVVRDGQGKPLQVVVTYSDGKVEPVLVRPDQVHESSSTRTADTPSAGQSMSPPQPS